MWCEVLVLQLEWRESWIVRSFLELLIGANLAYMQPHLASSLVPSYLVEVPQCRGIERQGKNQREKVYRPCSRALITHFVYV